MKADVLQAQHRRIRAVEFMEHEFNLTKRLRNLVERSGGVIPYLRLRFPLLILWSFLDFRIIYKAKHAPAGNSFGNSRHGCLSFCEIYTHEAVGTEAGILAPNHRR